MSRSIALLLTLGFAGLLAVGQADSHLELRKHRAAASDLEVTGLLPNVPREARFVTRESLLGLPQVSVHVDSNEDFPALTKPGVMVSGVYLDVLARQMGMTEDASSAIEAICADGYAAAFLSGYIQVHRPILVLKIDGLSPHQWAIANHGHDAGPYFVAYEHFTPSFRVLAHEDRPLEPDELDTLRFTTKEILYAGIVPKEDRDPAAADSPVESGYRIARQNCLRCHNSGQSGGSQSGLSWMKLEKIASERPEHFAAWVYDPRSIDPKTKMPPHLNYDKATLDAITKYFTALAEEEHR